MRFQVVDLLGDEFPAPNLGMAEADIILCRNLFIYLDPAAIQAILKKLTACLADGGFLLCAPGELLGQTCTNLVTRVVPEAVIYQKTQQTAMAYRPIDMTARAVVPSLSPARSTLASPTAPIGHEPQGDALAQAWARANRVEITKARKCCEKLQQQTPMNPEIHYLQAVLALAEDQRGRAREALRRVLYLQADFAAAGHAGLPAGPRRPGKTAFHQRVGISWRFNTPGTDRLSAGSIAGLGKPGLGRCSPPRR